MWVEINAFLKLRMPRLQLFLKRVWTSWQSAQSAFPPVPKRVAGSLVWVHPRLLTTDTLNVQPLVLHWIAQRLQPRAVFFDVGAHYGWMSIKAADRVGHAGHVVAFEPAPVLVSILNYHKRVNGLVQITVVPRAVSDRDGKSESFFLLNEGLSSRNSLTIGGDDVPFMNPKKKTKVSVTTLTLDSYCHQTGLIPSLVKIDVEGAELMVLQGAQRLLEIHHPDLIVAVHPYCMPLGQDPGQVFNLLARHGYELQESHIIRFQGMDIGDYLYSQGETRRLD